MHNSVPGWSRLNPKREPYAYFFDQVGYEPVQHRLIGIPEKIVLSQTLVAGIATAIPRSELELYNTMSFADKLNFVRAFLLTDDIQWYLAKIYREKPEDIERVAMHISDDFLRSDPRYEFAFFAVHLFLWIQIAQKHLSLYQRLQTMDNPYCLNVIEVRQALMRWVPLSIFENSIHGSASSRFPVRAVLVNISPVFDTVHRMGGALEERANTLLRWHSMSALWRKHISAFNPGDLPEALLVNSQVRVDPAVTEVEMDAFIGLLSSSHLACYTGIMKQLVGSGLWPLWYHMLRKKPLLLAEAQKLPNCPDHLLAERVPLRYCLEQVIWWKVPESFFALKPLKIESPFSAIETPKQVIHVLQPIDGDEYEARGRTPLERELEKKRAKLNLRITNILNGAEKVSPGKLEQLKQEEREISVRLRQIVMGISDFLSAQDIRTIEQQKKEEEHREKHIDIDVDWINWNAPRKSQATHIDFSSCEIPEGVSAVLTCETPYGETQVLTQVLFPLADSLLEIPHIQEMYKGWKFHYTVTFSCPPWKEFAIDTTQIVRRFSTDYVNAELTPDEIRAGERAAEMLKFKLKRQKKLQIKLQKMQEREKKKLPWKKIREPIQRIELSEHDWDMLVLWIILETFQKEIKPEIQEGALVYNLTQYLPQLGKGYILHSDYSRITVKEWIISPLVDDATAELLYALAERDKPSQNDWTDSKSEDQPDPEYLAFRSELQPIFNCLNGYNFNTKEKWATCANPFPSLNQSLGELWANIYMSSDKQIITLQIRPVLPVKWYRPSQKKWAGNMNIFAFLLRNIESRVRDSEFLKIVCTLAYNRWTDSVLRRLHGYRDPWMRECGTTVPPPPLNHSQRKALRDLELCLRELLHYYFASAEEKARMIREEKESCDLGWKFQTALEKWNGRVIKWPRHILFDAYSNGAGNLFPPIDTPTIQTGIADISCVGNNGAEGDSLDYLLYADGAIEFQGERKASKDERQVQETKENRHKRLESLRVSPWWRSLLRHRVQSTLEAHKWDRINVWSPAFEALKSCFTISAWKSKARIKIDDTFLDTFIDAMIARWVSVTFRRPVLRTPEQHINILAKIAAKNPSTPTVSQ